MEASISADSEGDVRRRCKAIPNCSRGIEHIRFVSIERLYSGTLTSRIVTWIRHLPDRQTRPFKGAYSTVAPFFLGVNMSDFPEELLDYCTTALQRKYYTAIMETGGYRPAARILGSIKHQSLANLVTCLKQRRSEGVYVPATKNRKVIQKKESATKQLPQKKKARYVITSAQNATPVFKEGLASLRQYCKHNKAELIVIPIRYHNPTSVWTVKDESSDWWAPEIEADIVDRRTELNSNLVLLADIRIQPTAVRPTSGMETFCGGQSTIIGHPKLEVVTIPTPQNKLSKIIHTTGAITVENYTDSKSGKKGEHHHAFGALVVEISGDKFFLRQLNMNDDGSFHDLDARYTPSGVDRGIPAAGLVLGDLHERFVDPGVVKATFGKGGIVDTVKPKNVVFHDVLDFHSQNHHHRKKVFTKIAKHNTNRANVEDEITECAAFVDKHLRDDQRAVFVPSNHPDAIARWVEETDWRDDPENAAFYLETALAMVRSLDTSFADPFVYWMKKKLAKAKQCVFPARDESLMIAGIEVGMHGDKGPNGSRGAIRSFGKIGVKSVIGHSHTPGFMDGVAQVGTSSLLRLEYNSGPSSWMHAHCLIYPDSKRSLIFIIDGEWRG